MLASYLPTSRLTRSRRYMPMLLSLLLIGSLGIYWQSMPPTREPPKDWEPDILAFEQRDRVQPPPANAVVFVGSSSIRLWKLQESFPDWAVINQGFGGSQWADSARFALRIVTPYRPRAIVVYAGDNDIHAGKSPRQVRDDFRTFVRTVRTELPRTPIFFLAIKPSPARFHEFEQQTQANRLIRDLCDADPTLRYIDTVTPMRDLDGQPRPELYQADGLHLNDAGYRLWTALLRPQLESCPAP